MKQVQMVDHHHYQRDYKGTFAEKIFIQINQLRNKPESFITHLEEWLNKCDDEHILSLNDKENDEIVQI